MRYLHAVLFTVCFCAGVSAQTLNKSSYEELTTNVLKALQNSPKGIVQDTTLADLYYNLADYHFYNNPDSAMYYTDEALRLIGQHPLPLQTAKLQLSKGQIYDQLGASEKAIEVLLQALRTFESQRDSTFTAHTYNSIGIIYGRALKNSEMAIWHYRKALDFYPKDTPANLVITALSNTGIELKRTKQYDQATAYYHKALSMIEDTTVYNFTLAGMMHNIGSLFLEKGEPDSASYYLNRSYYIETHAHTPNNFIRCVNLNALAKLALLREEPERAIELANQGWEIASELGIKDYLRESSKILYQAYKMRGKIADALRYHEIYVAYNDSLTNDEISKRVTGLQESYAIEKKQQEIALLESENANRLIQRNALIISLLLVLFIGAILVHNNRRKQKTNRLLTRQKAEINEKNEELNQINEELRSSLELVNQQKSAIQHFSDNITASLNYARRIQTAILPDQERLAKGFPDHFILYKPRDIVSGDFYWFYEYEHLQLLAVADCTGHGVPGAFMSMIGDALLNQIVIDHREMQPDKVLNKMHRGITKALQQEKTDNRDGMDIAIVLIDKQARQLRYAGAFNPLYYVQNGHFFEIKADKRGIGGAYSSDFSTLFTPHKVDISQPTTLYLCSDGFQDQFGGSQGRKFMVKRFRELLHSVSTEAMQVQKALLEQTLDAWMLESSQPQVDDILVIGVQIDL
jgi:serine phosphatase RsbU (regulator of sigma subunit)/Tfp pilus assembly protein PilF